MLVMLLSCYVAFIVGARWFSVTLPSHLEVVDNFLLANDWAWFLVVSAFLIPQVLLITLAVSQRWTMKWWLYLVVIVCVMGAAAIRVFVPMNTLRAISIVSLSTDIFIFVLIPLLIAKLAFKVTFEKSLVHSIGGYLLFLGFIQISLMVRNIAQFEPMASPLTAIILTIDVFIALTVVYFYSNYCRGRE